MPTVLALAGLFLFAVWTFCVDLDRLVRAQYFLVPRGFYLRHPFFLAWAYGKPLVSIRSWFLLLAALLVNVGVAFAGYAVVAGVMEESMLREASVLGGGVIALVSAKGFRPFLVPKPPRRSDWESQWPLTEKQLARCDGWWHRLGLTWYCKLVLKAITSERHVRRVTLLRAAYRHLAWITGSDSKLYCYLNSNRGVVQVAWERFEVVDQTEPDQVMEFILKLHRNDLGAVLATVRTFELGSEERRAHPLRMRTRRTLYVGPQSTGEIPHREVDESPFGMCFEVNSVGWRPVEGERVRVSLADKSRVGEVAHVTRAKRGLVFGVRFDFPDDGGMLRYGTTRFWGPRGPAGSAFT